MRKLEIGPHNLHKLGPDWETLDCIKKKHVDVVHDIRQLPWPYENDSFDFVLMNHVLEHLSWVHTVSYLKEIHRIIKPGGVFEVWVPDWDKIVAAAKDNSLIAKDGFYRHNPGKDPMRWVNIRLMADGPGEERFHRAVFDRPYLKRCLVQAGFLEAMLKDLSKPSYGAYDHGYINLGIQAGK